MEKLSQLEISLGIEMIPHHFTDEIKAEFSRYTKIVAPNGKPIHIIAQDQLSPEKIYRCRSIMEHYLTSFESSEYGACKNEVANSMANNEAALLVINGRHREDSNEAPLEAAFTQFENAQDLYEEEITVEGDLEYITNDYKNHRDASFEEILHLVHEFGIGVSCRRASLGVLAEYQSEIKKQTTDVMPGQKNIWGFGKTEWIEELDEEGSLTDEYLAAIVDVYYGYWGAFKKSEFGMHGYYIPKVREDLKEKDPEGLALVEKFFHPELTYTAVLERNFEGLFQMHFDPEIPYTHKSQYLKNIQLIGQKNIDIAVNRFDNVLLGNEGTNSVNLRGNISEYQISDENGYTVVKDLVVNRDGLTMVRSFNLLEFKDVTMQLEL